MYNLTAGIVQCVQPTWQANVHCHLEWLQVKYLLSIFTATASFPDFSLVPRPPDSSRRGKGSGVTSPNPWAIAPEAWSGQSNCRAAFIGIMQKWELVLQSYHSKPVMRFIIQRCNSILTRLQHFRNPKDSGLWHQTLSSWEGWVWPRDYPDLSCIETLWELHPLTVTNSWHCLAPCSTRRIGTQVL